MRLVPVPPDTPVTLGDEHARIPDDAAHEKNDLKQRLSALTRRIDELQAALHAEASRALLVVLQGRDGAGKDGAIRGVFGPLDPQGVAVTAFKVPSAEERAHDYLWRVHRALPPRGFIGIFNRSHYEDVLVVGWTGWCRRGLAGALRAIHQFRLDPHGNGVTILKFFLHISREEQRKRYARSPIPTSTGSSTTATCGNARSGTTIPWRTRSGEPDQHGVGPVVRRSRRPKPVRDVLVAETVNGRWTDGPSTPARRRHWKYRAALSP
jgi:hypothetical protein